VFDFLEEECEGCFFWDGVAVVVRLGAFGRERGRRRKRRERHVGWRLEWSGLDWTGLVKRDCDIETTVGCPG
jgi:hypothetical protein